MYDSQTLSFANLCMTLYDYLWLCMAMYDYIWLCKTMYGYVGLYMTLYDYVWLYMTIYEYVWLYHYFNFLECFKLCSTLINSQLCTNFVLVSVQLKPRPSWTIKILFKCDSWCSKDLLHLARNIQVDILHVECRTGMY